MKQKARTKQSKKIPVGIGIATLCGILAALAGVLILAWLISTGKIKEETLEYGIMILSILTAIVVSSTAIKQVQRHILLISTGSCLCSLIVLLGINALFFDGNYEGVGVTLLMMLGTGVAVALIALKHQNKPKAIRKKI